MLHESCLHSGIRRTSSYFIRESRRTKILRWNSNKIRIPIAGSFSRCTFSIQHNFVGGRKKVRLAIDLVRDPSLPLMAPCLRARIFPLWRSQRSASSDGCLGDGRADCRIGGANVRRVLRAERPYGRSRWSEKRRSRNLPGARTHPGFSGRLIQYGLSTRANRR